MHWAAAIEASSRQAWPALEEETYDQWILRCARGLGRGTNSVHVTGDSTLPLANKLRHCSQWYQARRVPACFRLADHRPVATLDQALSYRGYHKLGQALVMTCHLSHPLSGGARLSEPASEEVAPDDWFCAHDQLTDSGPPISTLHRMRVESSPLTRIHVLARTGSTPAACALGLQDGDLIGLSDVVTAPGLRRHGHARALLVSLLNVAAERGARIAWLHVQADNRAAINLYRSLGFECGYRLWYRVATAVNQATRQSGPA